jgi:hypothetical protein
MAVHFARYPQRANGFIAHKGLRHPANQASGRPGVRVDPLIRESDW